MHCDFQNLTEVTSEMETNVGLIYLLTILLIARFPWRLALHIIRCVGWRTWVSVLAFDFDLGWLLTSILVGFWRESWLAFGAILVGFWH